MRSAAILIALLGLVIIVVSGCTSTCIEKCCRNDGMGKYRCGKYCMEKCVDARH